MPDFIFDSWSGMGRVALNAALAYLALVVFLPAGSVNLVGELREDITCSVS